MSDFEEKIAAYFNNTMSPEQKSAFENEIKSNPELQEEIKLYQQMDQIFDESDWVITSQDSKNEKLKTYEEQLKKPQSIKLSQSIKEAEKNYFNTRPKTRNFRLFIQSVAAITVLTFSFLFYWFLTKPGFDSVYAEYKYQNELPSLTSRSADVELAAIEKLYQEKDYENILLQIESYSRNQEKEFNNQVLFYKGVSLRELNKFESSINTFNKLLSLKTLDADKAHWNLALVYLKMESIEEAKKELETLIKSPDSSHIETAKSLLEKLNEY